jgi:H+/Cl- antiporter ClcA
MDIKLILTILNMEIKEVILFIIFAVIGGIVGYLYYLYLGKKRKKGKENLNKKESILSSIFTFVAISLVGFFISYAKNYFHMFLIVLTVIICTSLMLGLLLRWKKSKEK